MDLKLILASFVFLLFAGSALAYYPYGPEYRIYGTETYLRTGSYPVYYTNYYPESYTVFSGPYESYSSYYYRPAVVAAEPAVVVGNYWRPFYYRDYPFSTEYSVYSTVPTSYVPSYGVGFSYASPSAVVSAGYATGYNGVYASCTESWCVRLN